MGEAKMPLRGKPQRQKGAQLGLGCRGRSNNFRNRDGYWGYDCGNFNNGGWGRGCCIEVAFHRGQPSFGVGQMRSFGKSVTNGGGKSGEFSGQ